MNPLDAITLEHNTDVVEWCPTPGHLRCLAVGTYQLNESTGVREGRLHLFSFTAARTLELMAAHDIPGIFDLRWHPRHDSPLIAAALADGSVRLLALKQCASWQEVCCTGVQPAAMAVSLDYSRYPGQEGATLAVSYSDGTLQQLQVRTWPLASLIGSSVSVKFGVCSRLPGDF